MLAGRSGALICRRTWRAFTGSRSVASVAHIYELHGCSERQLTILEDFGVLPVLHSCTVLQRKCL